MDCNTADNNVDAPVNNVDAPDNNVDAADNNTTELLKNSWFDLPIGLLHDNLKYSLDEHVINDIELVQSKTINSIYAYVFNPVTPFGKMTINLWNQYYTTNTTFLKESQTLINTKLTTEVDNTIQTNVKSIWNEICSETGFKEKYNYINWSKLEFLNNNSKFLQWMCLYNMASPIFSLLLPFILLLIPLAIIKMKGLPITIPKYIELLKTVFKNHQIGKIFDINNASIETIVYVFASAIFYVFQIYQNIMACRDFFINNQKIHSQLFTIKDYLQKTMISMDRFVNACSSLDTYKPFLDKMKTHTVICSDMYACLSLLSPNKLGIKKTCELGMVMKCFYKIYRCNVFKNTLLYTFGINGFIDNIIGLHDNIKQTKMNTCNFNCNSTTKFKKAYYPVLVNNNPIKNSYKLDKHLILTGPNASGKTTLLKTTIFNIILSQQIGFGFYTKANIHPYDTINCYINIPDTSGRDSLFQAEARRCKHILNTISENDKSVVTRPPRIHRHLCVFDELFSGTNPYEAIASAYGYLLYLNKHDNINFVLTTHFLELCKKLSNVSRMHNFHMKIDTESDKFAYTYKLKKGISDIKGGVKVLKDLDYPREIIDSTNGILHNLSLFV